MSIQGVLSGIFRGGNGVKIPPDAVKAVCERLSPPEEVVKMLRGLAIPSEAFQETHTQTASFPIARGERGLAVVKDPAGRFIPHQGEVWNGHIIEKEPIKVGPWELWNYRAIRMADHPFVLATHEGGDRWRALTYDELQNAVAERGEMGVSQAGVSLISAGLIALDKDLYPLDLQEVLRDMNGEHAVCADPHKRDYQVPLSAFAVMPMVPGVAYGSLLPFIGATFDFDVKVKGDPITGKPVFEVQQKQSVNGICFKATEHCSVSVNAVSPPEGQGCSWAQVPAGAFSHGKQEPDDNLYRGPLVFVGRDSLSVNYGVLSYARLLKEVKEKGPIDVSRDGTIQMVKQPSEHDFDDNGRVHKGLVEFPSVAEILTDMSDMADGVVKPFHEPELGVFRTSGMEKEGRALFSERPVDMELPGDRRFWVGQDCEYIKLNVKPGTDQLVLEYDVDREFNLWGMRKEEVAQPA